jgi:hypothetical protein
MSSPLAVINRGLVRLGVPPLASLSDADAQALAAATLYDEVKKAELAVFPWSFALRETALPLLNVPSHQERWTGFDYTYQLPPNNLRVLGLTNYDAFKLTGDQLHTNTENARLVYIENVGEQNWPEYFQKIVSFEFAASVAISLTDDSNRASLMYGQAMAARRTARSIDSQQTPHTVLQLMRIYQKPSYNPLTSG